MNQANAIERFDKNPKQKIQIDSWDEVYALELNEPLHFNRYDEIDKYYNDKYECTNGELF